MTDAGAKPYTCQLCQKSFAKLSDLEPHVRTHTENKPYGCQLCEKSFCYSSSLKMHMRTHTGEKPYRCQICEKSYADRSGLKWHLKLHTGVKSYIHCHLCQISFPFHSQMETHMAIHNGEKSYIFEGLKKIENIGKHRRNNTGTEKQQSLNETTTKRCSTADQFKLHSKTKPQDLKIGTEVIAKLSDRFIAFSSAGVIDSPNEDFSKNIKYPDSSGNAGQLQTINVEDCLNEGKVKSSVDKKASFSTTFGCGICDELFEREKDFLEHCSSHQFSPPIAW